MPFSFRDKVFKRLTVLHQKFISLYEECSCKQAEYSNCQLGRRTHDVGIKVNCDGHIGSLFPFRHKWCRNLGNGICSDASL